VLAVAAPAVLAGPAVAAPAVLAVPAVAAPAVLAVPAVAAPAVLAGPAVAPGAIALVAHGSADPRAAATTRALARSVGAAAPAADVRVAFLDHAGPRLGQVLRAFAAAGHERAVVVPLLLTEAYHARVDLPAVLAETRAAGLSMPVATASVLGGPSRPMVAGLRRRLAAAAPGGFDGLVLAFSGTRDEQARRSVEDVAGALEASAGVPVLAAYASADGPAPQQRASLSRPDGAIAVAALRAQGCRRVAVAAYFLAPGKLYDAIAGAAFRAGAVAVAEPLGSAPELVSLILDRVSSAPFERPGSLDASLPRPAPDTGYRGHHADDLSKVSG
jgi:sirohydrochlorin ferrochelatase